MDSLTRMWLLALGPELCSECFKKQRFGALSGSGRPWPGSGAAPRPKECSKCLNMRDPRIRSKEGAVQTRLPYVLCAVCCVLCPVSCSVTLCCGLCYVLYHVSCVRSSYCYHCWSSFIVFNNILVFTQISFIDTVTSVQIYIQRQI